MERVPVLKIGDVLLVSIQVDLQDQIAMALQEDLSDRIVSTGAHGVIIDISALEIVDSFIGRMLSTIASISKVLDATTVVVGMRPAVAITLVELGLSLGGVRTALNVEKGFEILAAARLDDEPIEGVEDDEEVVEAPVSDATAVDVVSSEDVEIVSDEGVVRVRQATRALAVTAKLSLVDQTKLVTAASELARNTLIYGGGGVAHLELVSDVRRQGVRATFADEGPGIPDVDQALVDGWTSGNGLGLGLSGARRLVDDFVLDTEAGRGTSVSITKWGR